MVITMMNTKLSGTIEIDEAVITEADIPEFIGYSACIAEMSKEDTFF